MFKFSNEILLTWISMSMFCQLAVNRPSSCAVILVLSVGVSSKDYEYKVRNSETLIGITATRLMLGRLAT